MRRPDSRTLWLTVGLSLALMCLLLASLPGLVWYLKGRGVVAAVEASFPDICGEWRDKLVARPSPAGLFTTYDVSCVQGFTGDVTPELSVNVLTCEVFAPLRKPRNWSHLQKMLFSGGQTMTVCP